MNSEFQNKYGGQTGNRQVARHSTKTSSTYQTRNNEKICRIPTSSRKLKSIDIDDFNYHVKYVHGHLE